MRKGILISILLIVFAQYARASQQSIPDTLSIKYTQELDTRLWGIRSAIHTNHAFGRSTISVFGSLTRRHLPGYEVQWKNDIGFDLHGYQKLNEKLEFVLHAKTQHFRDREAAYIVHPGTVYPYPYEPDLPVITALPKTGSNSRISRSGIRGGMNMKVSDQFKFELLGGAAWDEQLQGSGAGPSVEGRFDLLVSEQDSLGVYSYGRLNRYNDRQNHKFNFRSSLQRELGDAMDYLQASYNNNRSDLFLNNTGNVVSRIEDVVQVNNRLVTPMGNEYMAEYLVEFKRSNVDYKGGGPGSGLEKDFINKLALNRSFGRMQGEAHYLYAIEDRDYGGSLILGRRHSLGLNLLYKTLVDSISLRYSTEKMQFDSPDSLELSDRDRLIHRFALITGRKITPDLYAELYGSVYLDHLVYIESQRSGDNRWNRVFILSPKVDWNPTDFIRNSFVTEIMANYSAFDFETSGSSGARSTVYRRWVAADTLRFNVISDWMAEVSHRIDLEDKGRLQWEDFVEEKSDEAEVRYSGVFLQREFYPGIMFRGGYRWQKRLEYRFRDDTDAGRERVRNRSYIARGPSILIRTSPASNMRLYTDVSLLYVKDSQRVRAYHLDIYRINLQYLW